MTSESFNIDGAPQPMGSYPHARKAGPFLLLSGIGPRDPKTNMVPGTRFDHQGEVVEHDIEAQCHAVFENVKRVLSAAGANWDQLVDITVFLTDLKNDFPTYNRVYKQYFNRNPPCRTTVGVTSLPSSIAIELKCMAYLD